MRFLPFFLFFISLSFVAFSQEGDFKPGGTYKELAMEVYPKDTSAVAVVLNEFGEARFDNGGDFNLLVDYHVKIKILKSKGLRHGDVEVILQKNGTRMELVRDIRAASYRMVNGSMVTAELDPKKILTENYNKNFTIKKFAIPNVTVGSVIEYSYTLETPFYFNFYTWQFQAAIPKLHSEYWANIPANYIYNISLRGFLKLDKNESKIKKSCFQPAGFSSDCSQFMWAINNVPAFIEEEHMLSSKNYISSIHFELSEYHSFSGTKEKITKEWKDVAEELKQNEYFGGELRKAKGAVDTHVDQLVAGETNDLAKAKKIHAFIRDWFLWNGEKSKYSDGVKKAFEAKKGSSADINMALIAALKYADLFVDPVILSTRDNGVPTNLHPVIADFNYVIARLVVDSKVYLLDATDQFAPFGMLPERCLNGQGRVLNEKETFWQDLKPTDKRKTVTTANFTLSPDGTMQGEIQTSCFGYSAVNERKDIQTAGSEKEYIKDIEETWQDVTINSLEILNTEDITKPLIVKVNVVLNVFEGTPSSILLDPNITNTWDANPFKSVERLYPVDFGATLDEVFIVNIELPSTYVLAEKTDKVGLALPNNGGRFIYEITQPQENKITVTSSLLVSKPVFSSEEYHYLREIFNRVVSAHSSSLVLTRK
jgi:hypothetical protein